MTTLRTLTLGFGLLVLPLTAAAQTPPAVSPVPAPPAAGTGATTDARWSPWLGCWQLLTESVREGQLDYSEMFERAMGMPARRVDGAQVCMLPGDAPDTVIQSTWVNNQRILQETLRASGQAVPLTEARCRGERRSEWSTTGKMLYTKADLTCEGQAPRRISSLAMMSGRTWLDIQSVEIGGRTNIRVKKYQLAADQSLAGDLPRRRRDPDAERAAAAATFTFDDVKDASGKLAPAVIQAAMYEGTAKFPVNRERLIELDKAGVDDSVIDLMIALSFPEKFAVDRSRGSSGSGGGGGGWGGGYGGYGGWDPYSLLSLYAPYYYSNYGYYDPSLRPGGGWTTIPGGGGGGSVERPESNGRAVNGLGYTRIQPREADPIQRGNSGGSSGGNSGTSSTSGGSSGNSGGSSSGGSSGASSGGYSSGGGGGGGRTAVPRPPGQ